MANELKPHQQAGIAAVLAALLHFVSTLLVLPTGTGKTRCFAHISEVYAPRRPVLFLVNSNTLVAQVEREFRRWTKLTVGVEQGERTCARMARLPDVVIATVQTLSQPERLARYAPDAFSLVITDEAHHAVASTYKAIYAYFVAARVFGTATPDRLDGRPLGEVCEHIAFVYELYQAIREGNLVPILHRRVRVRSLDFSHVRQLGDDFDRAELEQIMMEESHLHAVVAPTLEHAGKRKTLIFAAGVPHAYALAAILNRGVPPNGRPIALALDGSLPPKVIADALAAYKRGEFQFLIGCDLFLEGFDEPSITCVVVARPTQSRARYCQMIGRGTRLFPGKTDVLVLDFVGNSGKHHLVGPVDLLGTKLDDRVREAAERRIEAGEQVVDAIDRAKGEIEAEDARRELAVEEERRKPIQAQATSQLEEVTNEGFEFFGFKLTKAPSNGRPMTQKQVTTLLNCGLSAREIKGLDRAQAGDLLGKAIARVQDRLCTRKQAQLLKRHGVDARRWTFADASQLIKAIKRNGWKPLPPNHGNPGVQP